MPIFKDLSFESGKELKVSLLRQFYFNIPVSELKKIGEFEIKENEIIFKDVSEKKATNKFNILISKYIVNLRNKLDNRKAIYIHQNSGIPLIGSNFFGIIDRNTNCIEVKPVTGCNLNCIYCSVDEGKGSKKEFDFIVEKDYLVEEFRKLVELKKCDDIEVHIGVHGEPLFYEHLTELISDLSSINNVKKISIDTNGTLLTEKKVDELVNAGLTQINLSINSLDERNAEKIAGTKVNIEHIKRIAHYITKKCELIIAPVYLAGINENDIEELVKFSKELNVKVGIQNFLYYKHGRNPTPQISWEEFKEKLKKLEEKYKIQLLFDFKKDFNIHECKGLDKPFSKGDIVKAKIMCNGMMNNEKIAVAEERVIVIPNCDLDLGKTVKLKITRSKHNVFYGGL